MYIDMCGGSPQRPLMGPECRVNHRKIGLGSANQKMNGRILFPTKPPYFFGGSGADTVFAVSRVLLQIGREHSFHHFGMAAFTVIIVKINHTISPVNGQIFFYP